MMESLRENSRTGGQMGWGGGKKRAASGIELWRASGRTASSMGGQSRIGVCLANPIVKSMKQRRAKEMGSSSSMPRMGVVQKGSTKMEYETGGSGNMVRMEPSAMRQFGRMARR